MIRKALPKSLAASRSPARHPKARTPGPNPRTGDGFRTIDFVVLAMANLGGDARTLDIEDIAFEAYRLAPHRFRWRRYPEQIDLAAVRDGLSDGRKPEFGSLTVGDRKQGWALTPAGKALAETVRGSQARQSSVPHMRIDPAVRAAERQRVLASGALRKVRSGDLNKITPQDVQELLRVDAYVTQEKYGQRVALVLNAFADEPEIQTTINTLEERYRTGGLGR